MDDAHAAHVVQALEAGLDVVIEKPTATTAERTFSTPSDAPAVV